MCYDLGCVVDSFVSMSKAIGPIENCANLMSAERVMIYMIRFWRRYNSQVHVSRVVEALW
jgi:hypothetical protein